MTSFSFFGTLKHLVVPTFFPPYNYLRTSSLSLRVNTLPSFSLGGAAGPFLEETEKGEGLLEASLEGR